MDAPPFDHALQLQVTEILDRCTTCGACAEVCPMPGPAGLDTSNPQALTAGILTLLRGGVHAEASRWAAVCSGSGHCIPACQHGVNPRLMLSLARVATLERTAPAERPHNGIAGFGGMDQGAA